MMVYNERITFHENWHNPSDRRDPAEVNPVVGASVKGQKKEKINFLLWPLIYLHIVSITPNWPEYIMGQIARIIYIYIYTYVCVCIHGAKKEGLNGALFSFFYFVTFLSVGRHPLRTGLAWDSKVRVGFCLLFYSSIPIWLCTYRNVRTYL